MHISTERVIESAWCARSNTQEHLVATMEPSLQLDHQVMRVTLAVAVMEAFQTLVVAWDILRFLLATQAGKTLGFHGIQWFVSSSTL